MLDTPPRRTAHGTRTLAHEIFRLLRDISADFSQKSVQYQPWLIVAVLTWAATHDRPRYWACDPRNWATTTLRPAALPSPSAVSRRSRSLAVGWLLRAVQDHLRRAADPTLVSCLDGKPLPVGSRSSDRDARPKGPSGPGYKLHAIWAGQPVPAAWEVTASGGRRGEPVAEALVDRADAGGYLVANGNYDSSPLFNARPAPATSWWSITGGPTPARPPPREPAPPAEHRPAADGLRPGGLRGAWRDRAFLRQRRRLRGRPGAVAGMGSTLASGLLLGVGEVDHQRGPHRTKTRTYGGLAISSVAGEQVERFGDHQLGSSPCKGEAPSPLPQRAS